MLINKLVSLKLPPTFIRFIFNLTSCREVHFKYDDVDLVRHVFRGLPQGCVLSPLLYSIYVSDLDYQFNNLSLIKVLQYADDVCLYTSHKNRAYGISSLENASNIAADWFDTLGLSLAPDKSQICIFNKATNNHSRFNSIRIRNTMISVVPHVRFLGVILQYKLKWNSHIDKS